MTDETEDVVDKWIVTKKKTGYPIVILNGELEKQLGVPHFPFAGVMDGDGNIVYAGDSAEATLKKTLKNAKPGSIWPKKIAGPAQLLRNEKLAEAWGELQSAKSAGGLDDKEQKTLDRFIEYVTTTSGTVVKTAQDLAKKDLVYQAVKKSEGIANAKPALPATEDLARSTNSRDEVATARPTRVQETLALGPMLQDPTAAQEGTVIELPVRPRLRQPRPSGPRRFRIYIIDSGWNSVARRVLRHNFALVRRLHKEDPIYLLSRKKSRDLVHRHRSLIGHDPIIAVHDLEAMQQHGNAGYHGFHLHLGILRTPRQALTALQAFARFLRAHRQSPYLEADIRSELRREGILGAVEILLHKVPRVIGG